MLAASFAEDSRVSRSSSTPGRHTCGGAQLNRERNESVHEVIPFSSFTQKILLFERHVRDRHNTNGSRAEVTGSDWFQLGDVECRMNPERLRKFKANSSWINDTLNLKWPNEMGRQFSGFHVKQDVPGVEPNLLARLIHWSRSLLSICQHLILFVSVQESRFRFPPDPADPAQVVLDQWHSDINLLRGEERR